MKNYCSGAERVPEHVPVVIFMSCRVKFTNIHEICGIHKKGTSLYCQTVSETFRLFLGADV